MWLIGVGSLTEQEELTKAFLRLKASWNVPFSLLLDFGLSESDGVSVQAKSLPSMSEDAWTRPLKLWFLKKL